MVWPKPPSSYGCPSQVIVVNPWWVPGGFWMFAGRFLSGPEIHHTLMRSSVATLINAFFTTKNFLML